MSDLYEFTTFDDKDGYDYLYMQVGTNGEHFKGHFLEIKNINGTNYFAFETELYREDGMTYDGEFNPIEKSNHKKFPYIVGYFNDKTDGHCDIYCNKDDFINKLGELIVLFEFDKLM